MDTVRAPGFVQRHPELRWLAGLAVAAAVVAVLTTTLTGNGTSKRELPAMGASALAARVRAEQVDGYYGTVITRVDLSLSGSVERELREALPVGGALLDGSHTMRYWYGGADRQRAAVVAADSEQDVFRNGTSVLTWDSRTKQATRTTAPAGSADSGPVLAVLPGTFSAADLAPPQLAEHILAMPGSRLVVLRAGEQVAGRRTYELTVRPDDPHSRIASAVIEVDGLNAVPLAVRVYAQGSSTPAVDVAFGSITFGQPAAQNFTFAPPTGARPTAAVSWLAGLGVASTAGTGWETVASYRTTPSRAARLVTTFGGHVVAFGHAGKQAGGARPRGSDTAVAQTPVHGRVACVPILCLLTTSEGRILVGPVDETALIALAR